MMSLITNCLSCFGVVTASTSNQVVKHNKTTTATKSVFDSSKVIENQDHSLKRCKTNTHKIKTTTTHSSTLDLGGDATAIESDDEDDCKHAQLVARLKKAHSKAHSNGATTSTPPPQQGGGSGSREGNQDGQVEQ